ncbi:MAG: hypothetical protein LBT10_08130 [Methanobrevibacter sp.]|nr:hypothetical protein [Methanobrevibacter sp.]
MKMKILSLVIIAILAISSAGIISAISPEAQAIKIATDYVLEHYGDSYVFADSELVNDTYSVSLKDVSGNNDDFDLIVSVENNTVIGVEEVHLAYDSC